MVAFYYSGPSLAEEVEMGRGDVVIDAFEIEGYHVDVGERKRGLRQSSLALLFIPHFSMILRADERFQMFSDIIFDIP